MTQSGLPMDYGTFYKINNTENENKSIVKLFDCELSNYSTKLQPESLLNQCNNINSFKNKLKLFQSIKDDIKDNGLEICWSDTFALFVLIFLT